MKIEELLNDKDKLQSIYNSYIQNRTILKTNFDLSKAHLAKSDHNMEFVDFILDNKKFLDWSIVGLYYSIYHASLALLSKKGFSSKDHTATLCFLIKNFSEFSKEEIELIDVLQIKREEIEFYSGLKEERKKASYSTSVLFNQQKIDEIRLKSISFINKVKSILG